jgi:hypothetical protein
MDLWSNLSMLDVGNGGYDFDFFWAGLSVDLLPPLLLPPLPLPKPPGALLPPDAWPCGRFWCWAPRPGACGGGGGGGCCSCWAAPRFKEANDACLPSSRIRSASSTLQAPSVPIRKARH